MKKNILKFILINLVFGIMFFIFTNFSFAVTNFNVDTSNISDEAFNYLNICYTNVKDHCVENNLNYKYYAIFSESGTSSFTDTEKFINSGSHFYIILFNDNVMLGSWNNGCWTKVNGSATACLYTFYTGDTTIGKVNTNFKPDSSFSGCRIFYTNYSSEYLNSNVLSINYSIELSTTEKTIEPITAYTNYFPYEDYKKYMVYISTDLENWETMGISTFTDTINNTIKFRFFYRILENGTYCFKFLNTETGESKYITYTITNIISDSHLLDSNSIPSPHITYEKHSDFFTLKTQGFNKEDIQKYTCYYIKYTEDLDISTFPNFNWSNMGLGTFTNTHLKQIEYYYFFQVPLDSENCTYIFVFRDNSTGEYGNVTTYTCDFKYMNDYSVKVQGVLEEKGNRFNELIDFFKQRFGFLTFPFEFIANLLNRILNIEYGDPILKIPELYVPGTDTKIFNGYNYNFNTLLENNALSSIYNIYLIAVDFLIILGVIVLAKNTLMEVFGNG